MPPLLIAATTPDDLGFIALRSESLAQHFNMLRRLAENWQSGKTALARLGKNCWAPLSPGSWWGFAGSILTPSARSCEPGASAIYISATPSGGRISASNCWWRSSPTPAPGLIFSTRTRRRRRGRFMNRLGFARFMMSRGSLIACSARFKRGWSGENPRVTVPGPAHSPAHLP